MDSTFDQFQAHPPTMEQLHRAICEEFQMEYEPTDLPKILAGNAANAARVLARLMGEYAQVTHGNYQGFNIQRPLESVHPHSWVNFLGTVFDPLKWHMEGAPPYLFEGESIGTDYVYDEDFSFRSVPLPPPERDETEPRETFRWSEATQQFLAESIFADQRDVQQLTRAEIYYLTQLPFQYLLPHLPEIYQTLIEHGHHKTIAKTALVYFHSLPELS